MAMVTKKQQKKRDIDTYVEVVWVDAVVSQGWEDNTHGEKAHEVRSVGWILKNSKKELILAADVSNDDIEDLEHNRRIVIPKGWVKKMTKKSFG